MKTEIINRLWGRISVCSFTRFIFTILMVIFVSTTMFGCARFDMDVNVKGNDKVDVKLLIAYLEGMDEQKKGMNIEKFKQNGWECSPYSQDKYSGYIIKKENIDISEFNDTIKNNEEGFELSIEKDGFEYGFNASFLGNSNANNINIKSALEMSGGYMRLVLHVPDGVEDSNATQISADGKTLTWDLASMGDGVKATAKFKIIPVVSIVIGIVVFLAIVCVVFLILKKRKNQIPLVTESKDFEMPKEGSLKENDEPSMESEKVNMFCSQCGAQIVAGTMYCTQCGNRIHLEKRNDIVE